MPPRNARTRPMARLAPATFATVLATLGAFAAQPPLFAQTVGEVGTIRLVGYPEAPAGAGIISEAALRRILADEVGRECEPARIEENVAARYRALGYIPAVRVTCEDGRLDIVVRESSHRIAMITFDASDLKTLGVSAAAVEDEKTYYPVPESAPRDVLRGVLQTRPGDLYNVERYRADRMALARLGYVLLFVAGPPSGPDAYPEGALLVQSQSPLPEEGGTPARRRNYIGGTGGYAPRSGPSAGIVYQRRDLVRPYDRFTVTPEFNAAWGVTLQYAAPFLAEHGSPKRLYDLGGSLYSTYQNNRFLDGAERDERRTGVSVTLGARPLDMTPRHGLRLESSLRYEEVDIQDAGDPVGELVLRLGAQHEYRHTWQQPSFTLETLPSIEWAIGAGSRPAWLRPAIDINWHARLGGGFEGDLRVGGGATDRPVPEYELYSLGGVTTVRGFREDSYLGRARAVARSELWIPFARPIEARPIAPGEAGDTGAVPFEPRYARRLKAAIFFDAGTAWQTNTGGRVTLFGAGVGLRFVVPDQPLVIRLDYGWGLGSEGGEAFPYVSLAYHF